MMDSSSDCRVQKISSVIKGIYGCRSFKASIRTVFNVHSAAFWLSASSVAYRRGFYHLDIPVAEFIPDKVINLLYGNTQLEVFHVVGHFFYDVIQTGEESTYRQAPDTQTHPQELPLPSIFIRMKRDAFHTLFAKFLFASTRSM